MRLPRFLMRDSAMPRSARYGSALLAVAVAFGVRWMLAPLLGGQNPLMVFVLAVVVAAWYGGFGPGMLATALSGLASAHFFIEPVRSLWIAETPDQVRLVLFLLGGWLISALSSALHEARYDALSRAENAERLNRELEAANRAAEEARQKADAAARAQGQFLSTMSHEIRTPINAILGFTDLLQMGVGGSLTPRQEEYLAKCKAAGQHLLGLVNDILDLAKADAEALTMLAEPTPLRGTALSAVSMVEPQAAARGVEVQENSACAADAMYFGYTSMVHQLLINLLSNAVKFTEPGGRVTVCCRTTVTPGPETQLEGRGAWVAVEVEDTGIGIPAEQVDSVFEPFVQVEGGSVLTRGGTGLGLTISRRLARLMGGDLTVRSRLGQGSCFTLWLPAVTPEIAEPAWPSRPSEIPGLSEVGHILVQHADLLVQRLGDRIQADPAIPNAKALDRAQLEDHIGTFLLDMGKSLIALDEGGGEPAMMRDGSEIQRMIAELHGEQRFRVGWTADEVRRETVILWEEIETLIRREAPTRTDADVAGALEILHRLLQQAEQSSLRGFAVGSS
ncbi:hypothetical protein BH23GEM5_BH23GEM5_07390 [soil metagenome]